MMLRRSAALLLASLMLCGFGTVLKDQVDLTETDSGKTIEMKVGSCLNVVLEGNPTTGYTWEITSKDSPVLKKVKAPEFKPQSKLIGSGGKFTFQFKAARSGKAALKLVYHRSWEKKVPSERTFQLNITVID